MPSLWVVVHRWPPSWYRNSRLVYGRGSSVAAKSAIQLSLLDEFLLAGERVVDPVDAFFGERGVVGMRRSEKVVLAARFVEVVVQVRPGRDQAVHIPVGDQVGDDQPEPAGAERARHPEKNRDVVFEHLAPDAVRRGEVPPLKRNPLHPRQNLVRGEPAFDGEGLNRRLQEARLLFHARQL